MVIQKRTLVENYILSTNISYNIYRLQFTLYVFNIGNCLQNDRVDLSVSFSKGCRLAQINLIEYEFH